MKTLLRVAGVLALAGVLAAGALAGGRQATAADPITIGMPVGKTGFVALFDVPVSQGAEIAVKEINAKGGVLGRPLKIIYSDTKSDINAGTTAAADVIAKGADVLIPTCDYDLGSPAARAAQAKDIVSFACAGSPRFGFRGIGPLAFTISDGTPTQGAVAADFASKQGWRHPYLLNDVAFEYSKSWCGFFKERWIQLHGKNSIVGEDTFQNGDASMQTQVTRLKGKSSKIDVVMNCSFPPGGATMLRTLRASGVNQPVIGTAGFDGPYWLGAVPNASDTYAVADSSLYGDDPNPAINRFYAKFKKETGKAAQSAYPLYGYTIVYAYKVAIERAKTTEGKKLAAAISAFRNVPLLIGPTTYTKTCHVALGRPMKIIQYQKGKGSYHSTVKAGKIPKTIC